MIGFAAAKRLWLDAAASDCIRVSVRTQGFQPSLTRWKGLSCRTKVHQRSCGGERTPHDGANSDARNYRQEDLQHPRREGDREDRRQGLFGRSTTQALKALPPPPPGAKFNAEEQAKYRAFKEARRGAADYMADGRRVPPLPRRRLFGAAGPARAADRRMRGPGDRRRLRRAAAVVEAARRRLHRRALLREGRRRRRHLVLEPLSRHRLRRRGVQLPAAAGGDGLLSRP